MICPSERNNQLVSEHDQQSSPDPWHQSPWSLLLVDSKFFRLPNALFPLNPEYKRRNRGCHQRPTEGGSHGQRNAQQHDRFTQVSPLVFSDRRAGKIAKLLPSVLRLNVVNTAPKTNTIAPDIGQGVRGSSETSIPPNSKLIAVAESASVSPSRSALPRSKNSNATTHCSTAGARAGIEKRNSGGLPTIRAMPQQTNMSARIASLIFQLGMGAFNTAKSSN